MNSNRRGTETNGIGLPLNNVVQKDDAVGVGVRIAHASFEGKLSADGDELVGQFKHDEQGMALTLHKK